MIDCVYAPFGIAKAAPDAGKDWIVYIKASTPRVDFEREQVLPVALQHAAEYHLRNGRITWEHTVGEYRYDPSLIVGEPLDVRWSPEGHTLEKAWLYQSPLKPKAREIWGILESGGSLRASIQGSVLARADGAQGVSIITKIVWTATALTPYPINDDTEVQTIPYAAFMKALGTGGAAPLVMEDLQGARQQLTPAFAQRWKALTALLMERRQLREDQAKPLALALLIRRGEARHAYAPYLDVQQEGSV
jgi:hypothetical protein